MKKRAKISIVVLLLLVGAFGAYYFYQQKRQIAQISSFEQCAEAGFPILDSYPAQCRVSDGRSFTQDIGNELEFSDEFLISNPRPNQKVSSPLKVEGKARGTWYFEANFSGELFDDNNRLLGTVILTAQEEWMSEDFVPFEGLLEFLAPSTGKGRLIFKNANPSGLPENEKEIVVPVRF